MVGGLAASEIQPRHVTAWVAAREIGPNTATIARRITKIAWRWAVMEGHLDSDPLAKVRCGTIGRRREVNPNSVKEWVNSVTCPALFLWCRVGLEAGMRPGEQISLTWQDIDIAARSAKVSGKRGKRTVYLTAEIARALEHEAERWRTGPILRNPFGRPWTVKYLDSVFGRHSESTGIDLVPYDLRHEFASALHRRGVDVLTISRLLGHASIVMASRHYVRSDAGTLLRALDGAR